MTTSLSPISRNATRNFSTSGGARASILFQLAALSNARETQHFNKKSKLDRYEHSPNLKLIKTSEIDPYPVPTSNVEKLLQNGTTPSSSSTAKPAFKKSHDVVVPAWDSKALAAGRAILADSARQRSQVARVVRRLRRRESRATRILQEQLEALAKERQRMREEMRSAGFLILLSGATATGFAAWTFWPTKPVVVDSAADADADAGRRRIVEQANAVAITPLYSRAGTTSTNTSVATGLDSGVSTTAATQGPDTAVPTPLLPKERRTVQPAPTSWTWRNLFWKHQ